MIRIMEHDTRSMNHANIKKHDTYHEFMIRRSTGRTATPAKAGEPLLASAAAGATGPSPDTSEATDSGRSNWKAPTQWERMVIGCRLPAALLRRALDVALEAQVSPQQLKALPSLPERLQRAHRSLVHSLHWLLFERPPPACFPPPPLGRWWSPRPMHS